MDLHLNEVRVERDIAGRKLSLSTGLVAKQAAGSVVVQYGDTVVLTAVTTAPPRNDGADFFPLMVDYREKTYAAGKFPGGFFKREKAPSTKETLTMRLADRPLRPLFPKNFRDEVLVQSIVLSSDMQNDPDILSMIGASASVALSDLPCADVFGAVRIGMNDGALVVNPLNQQIDTGSLNLVVAATRDSIMMVESSANEIAEEKMLEALSKAHEICRQVAEMINELVDKAGRKQKKQVPEKAKPACFEQVRKECAGKIEKALCTAGKFGRREAAAALRAEIVEKLAAPEGAAGPTAAEVKECFESVSKHAIRDLVKKGTRVDGRDLTTVRPIDCRIGVLPRTHGSSLFTRGETQVLVTVTLGSVSDTQMVDGVREAYEEKWYLHYQAPGFSVGEAKMPRGPGRRDIGHGMLGQRALTAVMPHDDGFPYTVRAVSEVLEMNGSSSMATVCGATLALMDAGVPIRKPVAGIAMGLIQDPGEQPVIITDILGDEDHCGDMDFKVCGTSDGVTALQMDIKVKGISIETMRRALAQAREGRLHILGCIASCIAAPRAEISPRAPRLHSMTVPQEFVGKIIGSGGKTIRGIQEQSGAEVNIDEENGVGVVTICAPDGESLGKAVNMIEKLIELPELNRVYEGPVTSVREFGVFVEILPGTEGMCHVSELSDGFVKSVEDVCKAGDVLKMKVIEIDPEGKVRLSRKAVILEERGEEYTPTPRKSGPRPGGDRRRGGGGRR